MAATYLVLGKVGLLLIGVFLGVILHVSWEGTRDDAQRKKELGLVAPDEFLAWPEKQKSIVVDGFSDGVSTRTEDQSPKVDLEYSTFQPAVGAALRSLTDATIDNYVK